MRLLYFGDNGKVSLTKDLLGNDKIPPYAILSHTWGKDEVTFNDIMNNAGKEKLGYNKIRFCMQQAAKDGLDYSWVDTCCIDKNDFTELQHAINSFFRWYRDAATCYVFLSDVSATKRKADSEVSQFIWEPAFRNSCWFTRGWTLQELLASRDLKFFSYEWDALGDIQELKHLIHSITNLPIAALTGAPLEEFGIEERLGWTKNRTTTRDEDKAYSLLGIFGVFMPLIYGEGQEEAFRRLRREIHDRKYNSIASVCFSDNDFECIRSLSFPEQEQRLNEIHTAHDTCQWLFRDQRYKAWISAPQGILWMKGNPGVGKSVVMKHAVRNSMRQGPDELRVSFFLHGQGTSLQKTPLGLFRALLNQLIPHYPSNLVKLTSIYRDRELRYGGYVANRWHWDCNELREALFITLVQERTDRPVTIFIDALDECGEEPARHLLEYFSNLMRQLVKEGALVKICLSSRHYPWYVQERLRDLQPFFKSAQLFQKILTKAQGSFQWIFLVTQSMKTKIFIGGKAETLLKDLAICPESLNDMYAALVQARTASEKHQMTKLFQWIMFAERPLSAQELREALAVDASKGYRSVKELRSQECWSDTLDGFERYITHLSRGLVEFHSRDFWEQHEPGGEDWNREAQLIHQSVADFLLETPLHGIEPIQIGTAHLQISRSCLQYIGLDEVLAGCQLQRGTLSLNFPLALYTTRYIFTHISAVEKARVDQPDLLSIIGKVTTSDTAPKISKLWESLNPYRIGTPVGWPFASSSELHLLAGLGTTTTLNAFLNAKDKMMDTKDLNGNSPLHVALAAGHEETALILLDRRIEEGKGHQSAIAHDINVMKPVASRIDISARNDEGETILDIAFVTQAYEVVERLISLGVNINRSNQSRLFLQNAISNNDMAILAGLIRGNIDLSGALYFAIEVDASDDIVIELVKAGAGSEEMVPAELDIESDFDLSGEAAAHGDARNRQVGRVEISANGESDSDGSESHETGSQDSNFDGQAGGNTLHLACERLLSSKVELLLSHGVPATSRGYMLRCPLHVIIDRSLENEEDRDASYDVTKLLLSYAPELVEFKDNTGDTALDIAVRHEEWTLASYMIKSGHYENRSQALTNFLLRCTGQTELHEIIGPEDESPLLGQFEKLDLKQTDSEGRTILWLAAALGMEEFIAQLLKNCTVDVNLRDHRLISPLMAAIRGGHYATVDILLQVEDLDVNASDDDGSTLLLEAIASQGEGWWPQRNNIGTEQNGNALHLANQAKMSDFVNKLLTLEKLDVNRADNYGDSPLCVAAEQSDQSIFYALVEDIRTNLYDEYDHGQSILSWAAEFGNAAEWHG
ncbi:hypothetical protein OPT61_g4994 [Boeremia exigua]|uniref:Uncharacterized protein n=1 Tax=Boeremia exigua TaxID=749465 RepID=A0ACC2IC58_9PLEO|nr:hypothetical protein OPT61_g4994 [Boeremia exigua]